MSTTAGPQGDTNPLDLLRSRTYVVALCFAALIGVPIAVVSYGFLTAVSKSQHWLFSSLPGELGFSTPPWWWPLPLLVLGGLGVAAAIRYLPGAGGHEPSNGLTVGGVAPAIELPGIVAAAFVTLSVGAVLGPEAPLIAIGGGLAAWSVQLAKKDAPVEAAMVIGAAGYFAAISTLFGSPLVGAFLLMEIVGLGGPMLGVVLVPGLLASGIGALIFVGLDSLTGLGTFSLAVPDLPPIHGLNGYDFLWAIAIGLLGALLGMGIKRGSKLLQPVFADRRLLWTPLAGAVIALAAIVFGQLSTHGAQQVLFSGESALGPLIGQASTWTAGALVLLLVCKGVAYVIALASFRGGPAFPSIFLGAVLGIALSHVGHLPMVAGAAMGIGAVLVALLGLPISSVVLTAMLLASDAATLTPVIIVSVVVSYVVSARLEPIPEPGTPAAVR